jgi:uncharacterized protein with GYD domain
MPTFMHQVSYTTEAWNQMIAKPEDRLEAVRKPIEQLGGQLLTGYFAFGDYDVIAITEMPDNASAAAIAIAFAAGGSCRNVKTTSLMTAAETMDALRKASKSGYKPVAANVSAAAAGAGSRNKR